MKVDFKQLCNKNCSILQIKLLGGESKKSKCCKSYKEGKRCKKCPKK